MTATLTDTAPTSTADATLAAAQAWAHVFPRLTETIGAADLTAAQINQAAGLHLQAAATALIAAAEDGATMDCLADMVNEGHTFFGALAWHVRTLPGSTADQVRAASWIPPAWMGVVRIFLT